MSIEVVAAVIRRVDFLLITRRAGNRHLGGYWEFPGGKLNDGESKEQGLQREIHEETGLQIRVNHLLHTVEHDYTERFVRIHFFDCSVLAGDSEIGDGITELKWVRTDELGQYAFPEANRPLLEILQRVE